MESSNKLIFFIMLLISCQTQIGNKDKVDSKNTFNEVKDFPRINDSFKFINELIRINNLDLDLNHLKCPKISQYKLISISGSEKQYYLIEFNYDGEISASYPWRHQFLYDKEGVLFSKFSANSIQLINLLKNEKPYLLALESTSKGNGRHYLYKISNDTIKNVLLINDSINFRTYDVHHDDLIFEPNELPIIIKDINNDGYSDLCFHGKFKIIEEFDFNNNSEYKNNRFYDVKNLKLNIVFYTIK